MHQNGVAVTGKINQRFQLGTVLVFPRRLVGEDPVEMLVVELSDRLLI